MNYLPGLASNHDPSDLSLQSSLDYRHDPLVLYNSYHFNDSKINNKQTETFPYHHSLSFTEKLSGKQKLPSTSAEKLFKDTGFDVVILKMNRT
jgi:hypothetical protein